MGQGGGTPTATPSHACHRHPTHRRTVRPPATQLTRRTDVTPSHHFLQIQTAPKKGRGIWDTPPLPRAPLKTHLLQLLEVPNQPPPGGGGHGAARWGRARQKPRQKNKQSRKGGLLRAG